MGVKRGMRSPSTSTDPKNASRGRTHVSPSCPRYTTTAVWSASRIASQTGDGKSERWVRWTACYRETKGKWLIVHEHVSVPVDVRDGKALLGLEPEARG